MPPHRLRHFGPTTSGQPALRRPIVARSPSERSWGRPPSCSLDRLAGEAEMLRAFGSFWLLWAAFGCFRPPLGPLSSRKASDFLQKSPN